MKLYYYAVPAILVALAVFFILQAPSVDEIASSASPVGPVTAGE